MTTKQKLFLTLENLYYRVLVSSLTWLSLRWFHKSLALKDIVHLVSLPPVWSYLLTSRKLNTLNEHEQQGR